MIEVSILPSGRFRAAIHEANGTTHHEITMDDATRRRIFGETHAPEACIEAALRFLLDHEPKESILSAFDVTVIGRYFPEFEREIRSYLR